MNDMDKHSMLVISREDESHGSEWQIIIASISKMTVIDSALSEEEARSIVDSIWEKNLKPYGQRIDTYIDGFMYSKHPATSD